MQKAGKKKQKRTTRIGNRFRNINLLLFLVVAVLILSFSITAFSQITNTISQDYAQLYSSRVIGILNSHLNREIALIEKLSKSQALINWFADETDETKKMAAYNELTSSMNILYSGNVYFGIEESLNEFSFDRGVLYTDLVPYDVLQEGRFDDLWYFECEESEHDYVLNIDIDKLQGRKRVWLNHKVMRGDQFLGVMSTGLIFDQVLEELFGEYDTQSVRSYVINHDGIIQMDSSLINDTDNMLIYENDIFILDSLTDENFGSYFKRYLAEHSHSTGDFLSPDVIELSSGDYKYASIAPISQTDWSVISLYNSKSLMDSDLFGPVLIVFIVLLVAYVVLINIISRRMLIKPFDELGSSIAKVDPTGDNDRVRIAGTEREDSFGELALAIQRLLTQLGTYNRQLVEETQRAENASRAKTEFLANMSHEIRTPINAIVGMTHLGAATDDMERKNYCLDKIDEASNHLLRVINDILDMSKIEAEHLELSYGWCSLGSIIGDAVSVISYRAKVKGLKLTATIDPDLPKEIYSDDHRITQVISNLLSNAVKFTPEGGSVSLVAQLIDVRNGKYNIRVSVTDTGIGLSAESRERIFRPFEQAESGTSRKYGGTGLGLAISKQIIETMDGILGVESEPGKGSNFYFLISVEGREESPEETGEKLKPQSSDHCFDGLHILLAEDVEINREIFAAIVEHTGVQVDMAQNGRIAVEMFKADPRRYAMIMMDLQMPEMDGYTATRTIRELDDPYGQVVPIVAMTANVFKEDIERCLEVGMNDHIGKPIDYEVLMTKLFEYMPRTD